MAQVLLEDHDPRYHPSTAVTAPDDHWDSPQPQHLPIPMPPVTPSRINALKRPGDELVSDRDPGPAAPRSQHGSPMLNGGGGGGGGIGGASGWLSPAVTNHLLSPRPGGGGSRPSTPDRQQFQQSHPPQMRPLSPVPTQPQYSNQYAPPQPPVPVHPQAHHHYAADEGELLEARSPSRSHHNSPMIPSNSNPNGWLSPTMASAHLLSPRPTKSTRSTTPVGDEKPVSSSSSLRHPPLEPGQSSQPDLLRTSQIPSGPTVTPLGDTIATFSNKAILKLNSDLNLMAMGWSQEEWTNRRRLIQFFRHQEGNVVNVSFKPISAHEYIPDTVVVSCIFRDEWNECFVTSVDTIYLLEALIGVRFSVEEKNRIRRNLEGFKPMTVSKSKVDSEPFFKLIMGFTNPKPRNIEKDVKVFPWKVLSNALKKIVGKYSATYPAPVDTTTPSVQVATPSDFSPPPPQDLSQPVASTSTSLDSPSLVDNGGGRFASHPHSPAPNLQPMRFPTSPGGERFASQPPPASPTMVEGRFVRAQSPTPHSPLVGGGGEGRFTRVHSPMPHSPLLGGPRNDAPSPTLSHHSSHHQSLQSQPSETQMYQPSNPPQSPHMGNGMASTSSSGRRDYADYRSHNGRDAYAPPSPNTSHISHPHSPNLSSSHVSPQASYHGHQSQQQPIIHPQHQYMPHPQYYTAAPGSLFPSAEDYGVPNSRSSLIPPPMNHTRSFSEGPRRSSSVGLSASPHIGAPGGWNTSNGGGGGYMPMYPPAAGYYGGDNGVGDVTDWERADERETSWGRAQASLIHGMGDMKRRDQEWEDDGRIPLIGDADGVDGRRH